MVRRAEKFHEVKHDAVKLTGLLWDSWKGYMSHLTRKKMLSLQVRACFHYALAFSQQLSWRLRPSLAACASIRLWLRRTTSPMGRDIDPGPCRRPSGRRFVLHRTFGPRLRYAALQPKPSASSRIAAAAAGLHAATVMTVPGISRTHHHHPSPGHSQTSISTLLTCPSATRASFPPSPCALCAGLCGASSDRCGPVRAAARAAGAVGAMAAACAQAEAAFWPPVWAVAAVRAPVWASQAAF